ncbi:RHS repeat-associated core domain-containing protein [Paenibacillus arenilitoris]|uniref:Insecticide toxin TcdB middle/N-terminal domain-containing protein n=1 Tax=Paenibacillus arenilitoris TaxID=2772299 RepID=A0A927CGG8_9BACL|nr:RHS repeat-associated core domain-containing protein [Paenibacillus arenilitoris]MBD2867659.1 hypothetical protein [Paenibacillus arenilitoris]
MLYFIRKSRKIIGLIGFSFIAVAASLFLSDLNLAKAAIPGAAGDGVVSPVLGSYGASIPIQVPDYYDLEPELKLTYSSSGSNGFVGVGWNLSGADSFFERVSSSGIGSPKYDSSDTFVLDGAKLIPSAALGGTHVSQNQSYLRITQDVANNKWYVWEKDGTKRTYTALYSIHSNDGDFANIYRWALTTVEDPNGNKATYNYWMDPGQNGYLDSIAYNGYTIKFWRESRPDKISFANGKSVGATNYRLKSIEINAGGSHVSAYKLTYAVSYNSKRSILKSVQQYGTDVAIDDSGAITGGTSLPPNAMSYYNPTGIGYSRANEWNKFIGGWNDNFRDYFAEVNGDGKEDLIRIYQRDANSDFAQVKLSDGAGYPTEHWNQFVGGNGVKIPHRDFFADVNGDGRSDFIRVWKNAKGTSSIDVNLSDGTGFPTRHFSQEVGGWSDHAEDYFVDVNGDGKADFVRVWQKDANSDYVQVNLSNGTGFPTQNWNQFVGGNGTKIPHHDYFVDVNGDGKADFVRVWKNAKGNSSIDVNLSDGKGFPTRHFSQEVGAWSDKYKDNFADMNGDGKVDFARIWNNGTDYYCQINLSNGFGYPEQSWNKAIGGYNPDNKYVFTDVNGDNKDDLVVIWNNNGAAYLQINLFDGVGYPAQAFNQHIGGWKSNVGDYFADVNGDGKPDLIRIYNYNGNNVDAYAQINMADGGSTMPDLLTSMTNGTGGTTTIAYTPSTTWPSQHTSRGGTFQTVSKVTVSDGRGNTGITSYSYKDAKFSIEDRAFMGFAYQKAVINDQGTYVETNNRQSVQSFGQADSIYTKDSAGNIFGYMTYAYEEGGDGVKTPFTSQVSQTGEFECNLSAKCRETRSSFAYDAYGNQVQVVHEGDVRQTGDEFVKAVAYNYNDDAYIVETVQSEAIYSGTGVDEANKEDETLYYYDDAASVSTPPVRGNLTRSDSWNNVTGTYVSASGTYDSYGNKTSSTDVRGSTETTEFDPVYHKYPVSVTNALGHTTTTAWDYTLGVPVSKTDADNNTTHMGYDALGRQISQTDAEGNVMKYEYLDTGDPNRQRVRKTMSDGSPDGLWTETYSDGIGRTYKEVKEGPVGGVRYTMETVYNDTDKSPQKTSLWYATGEAPVWERFEYDGIGRLTKTIHADGSSATVAYKVDDDSLPYTLTTDEMGHQKAVWADHSEKVTQVAEKHGSDLYFTRYSYDVMGNRTELEDASGNVTTHRYNSLKQMISTSDMDLGTVTYAYDNGGLMVSQTDANGQTVTASYDALGRIKTKTYDGQTTTWHYDEEGHGASIGNVTRVEYPAGSESYTYNNTDQVSSATQTIGAVSKTTSNSYDSLGRLQAITYPDGEVVMYGYSADGSLYSVSGYVDAMEYGANGELTKIAYANGTETDYTYDPNRLWLNTANVKMGDTTLYAASYTYNALQLVTSMTQGTPNPLTTNYTYDELGRLTSVTGAQSQYFTYDAIGNMMTNSRVGAYKYEDGAHKHAVTEAGESTYTYDASGNMLTGDGKTYAWDTMNRLTSVSDGTSTTSFTYADGDRRLTKTQGTNETLYFSKLTEQANGSDIQYYYAGSILVAKKDAAETKTWYHADRLGSIRLMTNESGANVRDYDYYAFGEVSSSSGTMTNERGFTGQIKDAETGLMYYNARYYNPILARFISADTAVQEETSPQDLNAYSYVANNPVNNTDPTGHIRVFAGMKRYVTWSKINVNKRITVKIPYIIIYPTFVFYWKQVSTSVSIWFFGWRTIRTTFYIPAVRVIWHVRTGWYVFQRTISFSIWVPVIHFRAIWKDVKPILKRAVQHVGKTIDDARKAVGNAAKAAGQAIATAAKATYNWAKDHKKEILTAVAIVGLAAFTVATGGVGALVSWGALAGMAIGAGTSAAFGIMQGKSMSQIAYDTVTGGALGAFTFGVGGAFSTIATKAYSSGAARTAFKYVAGASFNTVAYTSTKWAGGKSLKDSTNESLQGAAFSSSAKFYFSKPQHGLSETGERLMSQTVSGIAKKQFGL